MDAQLDLSDIVSTAVVSGKYIKGLLFYNSIFLQFIDNYSQAIMIDEYGPCVVTYNKNKVHKSRNESFSETNQNYKENARWQ